MNGATDLLFPKASYYEKRVGLVTYELQRSPPIRDSKGTKTFVYYRRSLLQNSNEI